MADEVGSIAELGQLLQTLRDSHSDLQTAADHAIESKDVDAAFRRSVGSVSCSSRASRIASASASVSSSSSALAGFRLASGCGAPRVFTSVGVGLRPVGFPSQLRPCSPAGKALPTILSRVPTDMSGQSTVVISTITWLRPGSASRPLLRRVKPGLRVHVRRYRARRLAVYGLIVEEHAADKACGHVRVVAARATRRVVDRKRMGRCSRLRGWDSRELADAAVPQPAAELTDEASMR
jgi:hypothetical protein